MRGCDILHVHFGSQSGGIILDAREDASKIIQFLFYFIKAAHLSFICQQGILSIVIKAGLNFIASFLSLSIKWSLKKDLVKICGFLTLIKNREDFFIVFLCL